MRRAAIAVVFVALAAAVLPAGAKLIGGRPVVIFVHGMGGNAADMGTTQFADLLTALPHDTTDVCPAGTQDGRPWMGSPCVFRYVEDIAEADEDGSAARGPNDSQSSVRENSGKLSRVIGELTSEFGRPVVLVGYSMGGAIIRTYLAEHFEQADETVEAVVILDGVTQGSWGYALTSELPRRAGGALGDHVTELLRNLVATAADVDLERPATRDLTPRSALFRSIARKDVPRTISYYTFWGDIRVVIGRQLLGFELPEFTLPSLGDLGLLPGDPDPRALPELGGQRFSPPVDDEHVSLDVPHTARIELGADVVAELITECGRAPAAQHRSRCRDLIAEHFSIPNVHSALPTAMGRITVNEPALGGEASLLDAVLTAIGRHG